MTTPLQPGANLALPAQTSLRLDIAWSPERPDGQEVDVSAFLLGADGRVGGDDDFVFYNNPRSADGALTLDPAGGAERRLRLDPARLATRIARVAVCLTLDGRGSFARASRIELRLSDAAGAALASFAPPTAGMPESALILGEFYRHRGGWKFRAVAQGFVGGLAPLARHFGVELAAEAPSPPQPPALAPGQTAAPPRVAKAPSTGPLPTGGTRQHSALAGLDYELLHQGLYALVRVDLPAGRQLRAQSDAMVAMSPTITVESRMQGGLLGGLGRLVSGESLFIQTLTASQGAGAVYLAPTTPGDIAALEITPDDGLIIQKGGFLACSEGVEVTTKLQNLAEGLFSGEGFFILQAAGRGLVLLESFGAIHRVDLRAGQEMIVDNGHPVAWSRSLRYDLELGNRGLLASFTSGEGIVCRFHGPGTLLLQTRQPTHFAHWAAQLLPPR